MESIIRSDKRNSEVIAPYLVADDVNTRPDQSPSRYVIDFGEMSESEAAVFDKPFRRLVELVKPARDKITKQIHETCFWKHWDKRPELYSTLSKLDRVLVGGRVTKYVTFSLLPTSCLFSDRLIVVASDRMDVFAVLQSSLHSNWVEQLQTSMGQTIGYAVSKCFSTFPWPSLFEQRPLANLKERGEATHGMRKDVMNERNVGLTVCYNLLHDSEEVSSDIQKLRKLHVEMDQAVGAAYGWTDLDLGHGFHETKQGLRYTICEPARREVLQRLLKLNHERYADEIKQVLHEKKPKKPSSGRGRKPSASTDGPTLFGNDDDETDSANDDAGGEETTARKARTQRSAPRASREEDTEPSSRPTPIEELDTDDIMAAFRQTIRGQGSLERDELLKTVSVVLGYQRLGPKIEEALRGHLRAAIRRRIIEGDGTNMVRAATESMADYDLDDLRETFRSILRKGTNYEREELIHSLARYLGFARVTDTSRDAIKSAINSAIRQGILGYEGSMVWREEYVMSFEQSFPTVARLLGKRNVAALDQHASDLSGKWDDDAVAHFQNCTLADWCSLNTTPEYRDRLTLIEWTLEKVAGAIDPQKFQSAFSQKAKNRDQFNQLLAEFATAATCAVRAKLLELEWRTGKENYDADVRAEVSGEPVNLEVTLRTDSWLKEVTIHMEDHFDEEGNQIAEIPAAKSRRTMTDREREDLSKAGVILATRVEDVVAERKRNPQPMAFVSDPNDLPAEEAKPKAYCADGDNPSVESSNVQRCIQDKAIKFNADGNHFVVLATMQPSFPSEQSVFDAVYGQASKLKHHGLFESGLYNDICGVLYLPVYQQLLGLKEPDAAERLARLFPNHNSKFKASDMLLEAIAKVFDAEVRKGLIGT